MSDFQNDMNRTVQAFVAQISELARRAAINTLESAFGAGGGARGGIAAAVVSAVSSASAVSPPVGRPRGGRGAKRTAEDLEALSNQLAAFVKANPGLRVEQINKELGTTTKDLALPIRKLLADSVITSKGQKRSTTYFPGRKAPKS